MISPDFTSFFFNFNNHAGNVMTWCEKKAINCQLAVWSTYFFKHNENITKVLNYPPPVLKSFLKSRPFSHWPEWSLMILYGAHKPCRVYYYVCFTNLFFYAGLLLCTALLVCVKCGTCDCGNDFGLALFNLTFFSRGQGLISWMTVPSYYKFCSHSSCRKVITRKFCTCHDSCAVLACAKFCSVMILSCYGITLKSIFHWIWNMMEKSFVKSTPGRIC